MTDIELRKLWEDAKKNFSEQITRMRSKGINVESIFPPHLSDFELFKKQIILQNIKQQGPVTKEELPPQKNTMKKIALITTAIFGIALGVSLAMPKKVLFFQKLKKRNKKSALLYFGIPFAIAGVTTVATLLIPQKPTEVVPIAKSIPIAVTKTPIIRTKKEMIVK